jgi:fructose/tagatose bisphosphate aldolase
MIYRLGFGPMSKEIVDIIGKYTEDHNYPLMIIASRNQVDYDSGYVMNTDTLSRQINKFDRKKLWLCRDHCGPYFLDNEKTLNERDAIESSKKTIAKDIEKGFDLIHIDTSRVIDGYTVAEELIKFCLDLNPKINFEFGTEENIGVAAGVEKYRNDVLFASGFPNMQFVVAQTGSLVKEDRQIGIFDFNVVSNLVKFADKMKVRLKEHNADYLSLEQLQARKQTGVHALNIAPQLGVMQTKALRDIAYQEEAYSEWNDFANAVLASRKWEKWIIDGNDQKKVVIAGHYLYHSSEYESLIKKISNAWKSRLKNEIYQLFDNYRKSLD